MEVPGGPTSHRALPRAIQDLLVTVGGRGAGETRPCQVPLVPVVLLAPREELVTQVLEGSQGCLVFLACGVWMAFQGSLAWLENLGLLDLLVLLAHLGTRVMWEILGQVVSVGWMESRVTLVTLESQASQDRGDRRARLVSLELQDLLEPEDGLVGQDSEVLLGLTVLRERRHSFSSPVLVWDVAKVLETHISISSSPRVTWGMKGKEGFLEKLADGMNLLCAIPEEMMDPTLAREAKPILSIPFLIPTAINKSDK
ncbi:hypothetical protein WISP_97789 [Willisornis vidua]|uniref:Uncharacterized protein n=1 Tax=Willisornis vidua TaxID=1566151 RepID=A0ABQ9D5J0_9PASS|nr:hypothetical protein WISP_97789 [Willisornis vidua]